MDKNLKTYIPYVDSDFAFITRHDAQFYLTEMDRQEAEEPKDLLIQRILECRTSLGMNLSQCFYADVYKPSWSKGGIWYYEVWVSDGEKSQKIRGGNTPYTTKKEAIRQANEKLAEMSVQYGVRVRKIISAKSGK